MKEIAPLDAQLVRSLGFGAQALVAGPVRLLAFVNSFPVLERFTLFYSNANERAYMISIDAHRVHMYEKVLQAFCLIEQDSLERKSPASKMEYVLVSSAAEREK